MATDILWRPTPERIRQTQLTRFMRTLRMARPLTTILLCTTGRLTSRPRFGGAVWRFCDIKASCTWDKVLEDRDLIREARWFTGSRLNFAENLLRYRDERAALVFIGEDGRRETRTYRRLWQEVARLAHALRAAGIARGDRVAGFLPNIPEAVIAMLATTSVGAIWSSCSPDFGAGGVFDRFGQIEPKILFTADGYTYHGKHFDSLDPVRALKARLPSIKRVVVVPYLAAKPFRSGLSGVTNYSDFLGANKNPELTFEQLPFNHPLYILYSSGTTGRPKCIVHGAGGTLSTAVRSINVYSTASLPSIRKTI